MTLKFVVDHAPVGQPRPRARRVGKSARVYSHEKIKQKDGSYKPHPIVAFKSAVKAKAISLGYRPTTRPVRVDMVFVFPRSKTQIWKRKAMPRLLHAKTPDGDNCFKAATDALTGVLWKDDAQISKHSVEKWIAAGDERPHVEITVRRIT